MKIRSALYIALVTGMVLLAGCASTRTYVDVYKVAWKMHPANDSAEKMGFRQLRSRAYRNQPPSRIVLYGWDANSAPKINLILTLREVVSGEDWGQILMAAGDSAGISATAGVTGGTKPERKFVRRSLAGELATGETVQCEFEQLDFVDFDVVIPGAFFEALGFENRSERVIGSERVDLGGCRFSNGDVFSVRQEYSMEKELVE